MGGIGDEAAALLFVHLQAAGELVKFLRQLGQLIVAGHGDAVGVLPFPHGPDAAQERPHPAGEKRRKGPEQGQHRQADHHGDEP